MVEALPDIMASCVVEALPEICCRGNVGFSVDVRLFIGVKAPLWPFLRGECEDIQQTTVVMGVVPYVGWD